VASSILSDNGASSGSAGLKTSADSTGVLALQTTTAGGAATTAVTIDTSQNVGIGGTGDLVGVAVQTPSYTTAYAADLGGNSSVAGYGSQLQVVSPSDSSTVSGISLFTRTSARSRWDILNVWSASYLGSLVFRYRSSASSTAEAMRIDSSGNLLVGTTTSGLYNQNTVNGISVVPGTSSAIQVANDPAGSSGNSCILLNFRNNPASGSKYLRTFYNGTTETGSISLNGSTGVLYNLTSDYRLKNNPVPVTGAKDFVMSLQPKTWDWWDNSGKGVGFIAHEFMEVAKYSGNGEKDAVDADGKPVYQSIQPSSSEVIANMVALMQEQQATINALTARIVALESRGTV